MSDLSCTGCGRSIWGCECEDVFSQDGDERLARIAPARTAAAGELADLKAMLIDLPDETPMKRRMLEEMARLHSDMNSLEGSTSAASKGMTLQDAADTILKSGAPHWPVIRESMWRHLYDKRNRAPFPMSAYDGVMIAGLRALINSQTTRERTNVE